MERIILITVFLLSVLTLASAQNEVRTIAEQMPYFPGCENYATDEAGKRDCSNQSLINFIANHLEYPSSAKGYGIEGTVMVDFIIDEQGEVTDSKVVYDIGSGCGEAALDVLAQMPTWEAGRHHNKPVKIQLTLPIHFSIAESEPDGSEAYQLAWGQLQSTKVTRQQLRDNLPSKIYVRDKMGNNVAVDEIIFAYERNEKITTARSREGVSAEMEKLVEKLKKDGTFNVTASVQDNGKFFYINRAYTITE